MLITPDVVCVCLLPPSYPSLSPTAGWLQPVADDIYKAECVFCNTYLRCHKLKLRQHAKSKKHHMNMVAGRGTVPKRRRQLTVLPPRAERRSFGRRVGGLSGRGGGGRGRGVFTTPVISRRQTAAAEQADREHRLLMAPQDVSYGVSHHRGRNVPPDMA